MNRIAIGEVVLPPHINPAIRSPTLIFVTWEPSFSAVPTKSQPSTAPLPKALLSRLCTDNSSVFVGYGRGGACRPLGSGLWRGRARESGAVRDLGLRYP